jgi:hypothetical protein|tara:strand:+ start:8934 stop:12491 length:3558 start_codon:yes stop_codon:yes gene_type:complete
MNLSDYQKSGNAFGTNVTEYPKFSVLKGKIPDVPGITSLPYVGGYIFEPGWNYYESFFGSKYEIVTPNGFVFYNPTAAASPILKKYTLTPDWDGVLGEVYDPFRQSIGSIPFQYPGKHYILLKNSGDTLGNISGFGIQQHADTIENYSKDEKYDLPFNYSNAPFSLGGIGLTKMKFSSPSESPFNGNAVDSNLTPYEGFQGAAAPIDSVGDNLKVFNFKKEQYIYLYTGIESIEGTPTDDDYKEAIDRHRLNLLSLFFGIPHKAEGYRYYVSGLGQNLLTFNHLRAGNPFDYDRTIERDYSLGKDVVKEFFEFNSFYEEGLLGENLGVKSREISSIAFQRFKEIEERVYSDYSFDVESSVTGVEYEEATLWNGGQGPPPVTSKIVKIPVPAGVPVNSIAMDTSATDEKFLTADIFSSYNHLNATWENALESIPEIAIPNVYDFIDSQDKGLYLSELFSDLGNKVLNCTSYEDLIKKGKDKKIIFIGDENLLNSGNELKEAAPMYNNIEFDIYSNANREIHHVLHKDGIYKDFLLSLLTFIYGPAAEYDILSDLYQKGAFPSEEKVNQAHSDLSKSILVAGKYIFADPLDQKRVTSIKPSVEKPNFLGNAITMSENRSLAVDFEQWYKNYLIFIVSEYNQDDSDFLPGLGYKFISKNRFNKYFTDFSSDTLEAPSEKGLAWAYGAPIIGEAVEKLKAIFSDKMREINNILSKEPSYSEPIMYRIEKLDIDNNVIQNIFIPHFADEKDPDIKQILSGAKQKLKPNIKKIRYIDSQVKYGKLYRYKVTQYRIVVASEYRYKFCTNHETDKRAIAEGYEDKFDVDTIMSAARSGYVEGPMVYDAISPPKPGSIPTTAGVTPFQFYSQKSAFPAFAPIVGNPGEIISKPWEPFVGIDIAQPHEGFQYQKLAIFKSILYPSIRIEEVPYYEEEVVISDFPPIPPNVNFDPLVGKGSQILMTFENQTGDREEIPTFIEPNDKSLFSIQRTAQGRNATKGDGSYLMPSLRFKSDDFAKTYQVFKSDTAPSGYGDFSGKKYKDLDVEEATAFIEDLEPNKTFYYVFRTVDIHGNVSNPSAVFAVQMTFNSGVYYPVVNTYEFNQQRIGSKYKEFQQYLKIEAALLQRLVNKEKSNINDVSSNVKLPILGIGSHSLWNQKKFKFRIISKHTGKTIDLNVKFNTNHTIPIDPVKGC